MFLRQTRENGQGRGIFEMSWDHCTQYYQGHPLKSDQQVINERKNFEAEFCHNKGCVVATADQYKKAEELLLRSLDIKLELYVQALCLELDVHPDIRLRYHALGNVYCGLHRGSKSQ